MPAVKDSCQKQLIQVGSPPFLLASQLDKAWFVSLQAEVDITFFCTIPGSNQDTQVLTVS